MCQDRSDSHHLSLVFFGDANVVLRRFRLYIFIFIVFVRRGRRFFLHGVDANALNYFPLVLPLPYIHSSLFYLLY